MHKKLILYIFKLSHKLLGGRRLGKELEKLPLVRRAYEFLYSRVVASDPIALVDTEGGRMYVDINWRYGISRQLFLGDVWEEPEVNLFKRIVGEGMTVVDLGASMGYYTLLAAKLVGKKGKVFAFEPEPRNFALLKKNIEINRCENAIPVQKAVSNKNGATSLFLSAKDPGAPTLYNSWAIYDSPGERESILVDVTTLDSFWENEGCPPIDMIKMDIEGAEMAALEGMTNLILRNDNLMIMAEFNPEWLQRIGISPTGFLSKLMEYGFKLYAITSQEPWIKPVDIAHSQKPCTLFCEKTARLEKKDIRANKI